MATHSSILAWRIPWTEELGGLQPMGSQSQTPLKRLSMYICNGVGKAWARKGLVGAQGFSMATINVAPYPSAHLCVHLQQQWAGPASGTHTVWGLSLALCELLSLGSGQPRSSRNLVTLSNSQPMRTIGKNVSFLLLWLENSKACCTHFLRGPPGREPQRLHPLLALSSLSLVPISSLLIYVLVSESALGGAKLIQPVTR